MKITAIHVENFLGARAVDVQITQPVTIFAGANFAGKSSLQEAIRMALTGETVRVSMKKEYGQLITAGAGTGFAEVEIDGARRAFIALPSGDAAPLAEYSPPAALPFVLDAQRFAGLEPSERRSFLFGLMGLSASGSAVRDRLLARGCNEQMVGAVMPLLRAGFDAAHKEAQAKARDAKAAWRAVTGETYGEKKADGWKALCAAPGASAATSAASLTADDLAGMDSQIGALHTEIGALQGAAAAQAKQAEQMAATRAKADRVARITDKLLIDKAARDEWLTTVTETRAMASGKKVDTCSCPECGVVLEIRAGKLEPHVPTTAPDPEAVAKLPEYERALVLLENAVKNGERDLAEASAAAQMLASLGEPAALIDDGEIAGKRARLAALKASRAEAAKQLNALRDAERAAASATKKESDAAGHHVAVAGWATIADALAPDGIPGELLADALGPINERLAQSAVDAEWQRIEITPDMQIRTGLHERAYELLSESERWRADAMIAEAIAHLSGVKLLVLDRFDVLDIEGRGDLIAWLDILAQDGEIDTALIFGTMKALPTGMPATVDAHWIESGIIGQIKEAA